MIDEALVFINSVLDQHLKHRFSVEGNASILNNLTEADGSEPQVNQNKVVLTLINLEHETAKQYYGGQYRSGSKINKTNSAIHFNLDLLVTANFDRYDEALKFLTASISYFQANNSFNPNTFPMIPSGLAMLNFEVENSPYEKTHNLWSALSAKYRPSIIYKIRHITVQTGQIKSSSKIVSGVKSSVTP